MADDKKDKSRSSSWRQGKLDPKNQKVIVSENSEPLQYEIDLNEKKFIPLPKDK